MLQFEMNAGNGKSVELLIYDTISSDPGDVKASDVIQFLNANANAKEVIVRISSMGGMITEGLAIYNALRSHRGNVISIAESLVASIATLIFLAGSDRRVNEGATIMVHRATLAAGGNSDDLKHAGETLQKIEAGIVQIISDRTGLDRQTVETMLDDETWMNADEAVSKGFAHSKTHSAKMSLAKMSFDLTSFRNVPAAVRQKLNSKQDGWKNLVHMKPSASRQNAGNAAQAKSLQDLVHIR